MAARYGVFVESPARSSRRYLTAGDRRLRIAHGLAGEICDAAADIFDGIEALHLCGEKADVYAGEAARQDFDKIADHRAFGRCDDADALREAGQGTLARVIEQSLRPKPRSQLLEGELQRTMALRLDAFDDELILAALLVNIYAAAHEDFNPVLRLELEPHV